MKAWLKKYWWLLALPFVLGFLHKQVSAIILSLGEQAKKLGGDTAKAVLDTVTSPIAGAAQWLGEQFYPPNPVAPASSHMTPAQWDALSAEQKAELRPRILSGDIRIDWK